MKTALTQLAGELTSRALSTVNEDSPKRIDFFNRAAATVLEAQMRIDNLVKKQESHSVRELGSSDMGSKLTRIHNRLCILEQRQAQLYTEVYDDTADIRIEETV